MLLPFIKRFIDQETLGAIPLFATTIIALFLSNSSFSILYQDFWQHSLGIGHLRVIAIVNEGLMALFFLLIGLELKREYLQGQLRDPKYVALPAIAAIGGMVIPALIFILINIHIPFHWRGWAIPVATDIAFALGVLSLLGKRISLGLKFFLMTLAIFDDLGAILIIGIAYTNSISWLGIAIALLTTLILCVCNWQGVCSLALYLVLGAVLWVSMLVSGIHPTLTGVILALFIPLRPKAKKDEDRRQNVRDSHQPSSKNFHSPLRRLEYYLHPWVTYGILPLFALANAGVPFSSFSAIFNPLTLGVMLGLFLGKQGGVWGGAFIAVRLGLGKLPVEVTWWQLYGVAIVCGIGFTMSLFLGSLAFEHEFAQAFTAVRMGVLLGSLFSGVIGLIVLSLACKHPTIQ